MVKEITAVSRLDATKIVYLKVKAFIPSDRNIETHIEDFEKGDVIFVRDLSGMLFGIYKDLVIIKFFFLSFY
jgi:hypothetical protein